MLSRCHENAWIWRLLLVCPLLALQSCDPAPQAVPSNLSPQDLRAEVEAATEQVDAEAYTEAEARLEALLPAEAMNEAEWESVASANALLARVKLQLKKHAEAADAAREAVAQYRQAGLGESEEMIHALSLLGRALSSANLEEARQTLMQALGMADQLDVDNPMLMMSIEDGLADVLVRQGNLEAAEAHYRRAFELVEAHQPDDREKMVQALTNLGAYYQYVGEIERSADYFGRARDLLDKAGHSDTAEMARVLGGEAFVAYRRGECDLAISLLKEALAINTSGEIRANASLAKMHHDLGSAYECAGNRDAALEQYRASLAIFERLGDGAAPHVQQRLDALEAEDFSSIPPEADDPLPAPS